MVKNKRFLLDTHIFIWWMEGKKLGADISNLLQNPESVIFLSAVSVWEMVVKKAKGKLRLPQDWKKTIKDSRFEILPINLEYALTLESLPLHHNDPFDRMLIAQVKAESLTMITTDSKIKRYKIPILG